MFEKISRIISKHCKTFHAQAPYVKTVQAIDERGAALELKHAFKDEAYKLINEYNTFLVEQKGFEKFQVHEASEQFKRKLLGRY